MLAAELMMTAQQSTESALSFSLVKNHNIVRLRHLTAVNDDFVGADYSKLGQYSCFEAQIVQELPLSSTFSAKSSVVEPFQRVEHSAAVEAADDIAVIAEGATCMIVAPLVHFWASLP